MTEMNFVELMNAIRQQLGHTLRQTRDALDECLQMVEAVGGAKQLPNVGEQRAVVRGIMKQSRAEKERDRKATYYSRLTPAQKKKRQARERKRRVIRKAALQASQPQPPEGDKSWVSIREKMKQPPAANGTRKFADYALEVLREAGGPVHADELENRLRAKGWTTKSENIRGLFGVLMPTVPGVKKVAVLTWQLR